jgi:hypothetical protein
MRLLAIWVVAGIAAGIVSGALFGWPYMLVGVGIGVAAGLGIALGLKGVVVATRQAEPDEASGASQASGRPLRDDAHRRSSREAP